MTTSETRRRVRVVCTECAFSEVVPRDSGEPAEVIIQHGRETGHKLTTEEVEPAR